MLGMHGIQRMSVLERALIFPALGVFLSLVATACLAEVIPGSQRRLAPGLLLAAGSVGLITVFGVLFRDYRTERFVPQGIACLTAGLGQMCIRDRYCLDRIIRSSGCGVSRNRRRKKS